MQPLALWPCLWSANKVATFITMFCEIDLASYNLPWSSEL